AAAAAAASMALVACGGHGEVTRTVTTPGAASSHGGANKAGKPAPLSAARARAFAAGVNLRTSDLPGFNARPRGEERETPQEKQVQRHLLTCIGAQPRSTSGGEEHGSPWFSRRSILNQSVSSSVSFLESASAGAQELAVLRSTRSRHCLSRYLGELFTGRHYGAA